jgi:type II secretory pathway pseudopilin PulG
VKAARDEGMTLVESLVSLSLLGLAIVAILGALGAAATTSGLQSRQADADAALRSAAELVKSQPYDACPAAPTYGVAAASNAPGLTLAIDSVEHWNGSNFQPACPVLDGGFQRITVRASAAGGSFERTLQFVKRRP